MESPDRVEVDPYVDNVVPVPEGDEQFAEAVGELPQNYGLNGQPGNGMPLEAGDGHDGPPPLATGNGHVAATSGPPTGSIPGVAEASTAPFVPNPVPPAALPVQPLSVSGVYAQVPPIGTMPGVWGWVPDPSEPYVLPQIPYPRMGYSPALAGRMIPVPITATARTAITTTVTPSVAVSAVQTGLVYTSFTGPHAPIPGAYAIRPGYGAADHQYHMRSTFEGPMGVGVYGYPDVGQAELGAIGGVPDGAVGYLGPSGYPVQGSLGGGAGAVPHYEQVTGGGYGA